MQLFQKSVSILYYKGDQYIPRNTLLNMLLGLPVVIFSVLARLSCHRGLVYCLCINSLFLAQVTLADWFVLMYVQEAIGPKG